MQHPRMSKSYWMPDFKNLPPRLQRKVHNPYECKYNPKVKEYPEDIPFCRNCNGIVPWFCYMCVKCNRYFVKDFRHPKFCTFYPTCWTHTLELEWERCADHVRSDPWFNTIVLPLGYNLTERERLAANS